MIEDPPSDRISDRFVAFLDVLGFERHLRSMFDANGELTDPDGFDSLVATLGSLASESRRDDQHPVFDILDEPSPEDILPPPSRPELEITAVSDCIVISSLASDHDAAYHVAVRACRIGRDLLMRGILLRGGIAKGPTLHEGGLLVGPGYLDAYRLESREAVYPRILLSEDVANSLGSTRLRTPIQCNEKGSAYLDLFAVLAEHREHQRGFSRIRKTILEGIRELDQTPPDMKERLRESILSQLCWAVAEFDSAIERFSIDGIEPLTAELTDPCQGRANSRS